ncbi:MAG: Trm112 family protein [Burkholderiaceae bacterium]
METRLLNLLVCPVCKGPLEHLRPPQQEKSELVCRADGLAFPIRDGIPVMLEAEARSLDRSGAPAAPAAPAAPTAPTA